MFRRVYISFFLLCLALSTKAEGANATEVLRNSMEQIITLLKDPTYKGDAKANELHSKLEAVVCSIFNFKELSQRAIGQHWQDFNLIQQAEITEAFTELMRATYLDKISAYKDERIDYLGERGDSKGAVEVQTKISSGNKDIPIVYRMRQNGRWQIYDVIIEGVSLVKNYRTQFQEIMVNGKPEDFIRLLRKKAKEISAEPHKASAIPLSASSASA